MLITGCDTGFGYALAKHLHKLGFTVFAGCLLKVRMLLIESAFFPDLQTGSEQNVFQKISHSKEDVVSIAQLEIKNNMATNPTHMKIRMIIPYLCPSGDLFSHCKYTLKHVLLR